MGSIKAQLLAELGCNGGVLGQQADGEPAIEFFGEYEVFMTTLDKNDCPVEALAISTNMPGSIP